VAVAQVTQLIKPVAVAEHPSSAQRASPSLLLAVAGALEWVRTRVVRLDSSEPTEHPVAGSARPAVAEVPRRESEALAFPRAEAEAAVSIVAVSRAACRAAPVVEETARWAAVEAALRAGDMAGLVVLWARPASQVLEESKAG
jgi:hypothetical protein